VNHNKIKKEVEEKKRMRKGKKINNSCILHDSVVHKTNGINFSLRLKKKKIKGISYSILL